MAKRIDTGKAHKAPYTLVSAGLLGSAFFFAFLLWQGGAVQGPRHGLGDYAPGLRCAPMWCAPCAWCRWRARVCAVPA